MEDILNVRDSLQLELVGDADHLLGEGIELDGMSRGLEMGMLFLEYLRDDDLPLFEL